MIPIQLPDLCSSLLLQAKYAPERTKISRKSNVSKRNKNSIMYQKNLLSQTARKPDSMLLSLYTYGTEEEEESGSGCSSNNTDESDQREQQCPAGFHYSEEMLMCIR